MTIEQTIEIPADRRITLEMPPDTPIGAKATIITTVLIGDSVDAFLRRGWADGAPENAIDEREQKSPLTLMDLYGSCEGKDTMEAYLERKRADKALEDEQYAHRFKEKP
ncbi:MAG: hypothetical protein LBQ57_09275 [Spirochaetales bacterium]|jgi:hypothetical protein|nr:hypothetical protein [Spirochaetales bacterium]